MYSRNQIMPDPWYIQVEPARACNLSCPHCVNIDDKGLMSLSTFKQILDNNKNLLFVKLQGLGEPLLNPNLAYMAEYAKFKGCRTEIISNGTIPPSSQLMKYIDCYVVSMETSNPDLYESIRGIPIDKVLHTLDILKHDFNGTIGINCVLTDDTTEEDVTNLKVLAKEYNAVVTTPLMQNWLSPGKEGYEMMQGKAIASIAAHNDHLGFGELDRERFCQWCFNQAYYDYHGVLHPCCIRMTGDYQIGYDWNGPEMREFRKNRKWHSFCKNCPL